MSMMVETADSSTTSARPAGSVRPTGVARSKTSSSAEAVVAQQHAFGAAASPV